MLRLLVHRGKSNRLNEHSASLSLASGPIFPGLSESDSEGSGEALNNLREAEDGFWFWFLRPGWP